MSAFIDKIEECLTGRNRAVFGPITTEVDTAVTDALGQIPEYLFEVRWGRRVSCRTEDFDTVFKNVIRELREAIYGELRGRLIRLERAVYECDERAVRMEIRDIMSEVFG